VRCPTCASLDDKVVDSRLADEGEAIRRRRECVSCGHRYTTFERVEEVPLLVVKRSGDRVPFDRSKIEAGVQSAAKGRPVDAAQMAGLAVEVEEILRIEGPEVPSERIGLAVLDRLRELDQVPIAVRQRLKDFDDPADFQREVGLLTGHGPSATDQRR
jgi:transcriptional repressor NrdR